MTCPTCDGTRVTYPVEEEHVSAPGTWSGYATIARQVETPCPDCARDCACCNASMYDLPDGIVPLQDFRGTEWWCNPECLVKWLEVRSVAPVKALLRVLVAKHVYTESCGCDFPGGDHSNGCHATVDALCDLAEKYDSMIEPAGGG